MSNFFVGYYSVIFLTGDANGVKLRKASLMLRNKMPRKWDSWNASYAILMNRNSHSSDQAFW